MSVFADSSALVKLYADEVGHEAIRAIRTRLIVSQLARVEVPSAIWRKQRIARTAAAECNTVAAFDRDLRRAAASEAFSLVPGAL